MEEWIATITFDLEVEGKLRTKHNLAPEQVREAIAFGAHTSAGWHVHPDYGRRLIVTGSDADGVGMIVYLRPIDRRDGVWECLTAWRTE